LCSFASLSVSRAAIINQLSSPFVHLRCCYRAQFIALLMFAHSPPCRLQTDALSAYKGNLADVIGKCSGYDDMRGELEEGLVDWKNHLCGALLGNPALSTPNAPDRDKFYKALHKDFSPLAHAESISAHCTAINVTELKVNRPPTPQLQPPLHHKPRTPQT
jgi:hypothetical protein